MSASDSLHCQQERWPALAAALLSLKALVGLELHRLDMEDDGTTELPVIVPTLATDLRSLCVHQLRHIALPVSVLRDMAAAADTSRLASQSAPVPLTRVRSLGRKDDWDASVYGSLGGPFPTLPQMSLDTVG